MSWWQHPYPGGPMVGPPFTRPLYPPSATRRGKQPSTPGEDAQAIKRTVSRLGRWLWQQFDSIYSEEFATGASGNVIDTGVAGLQRQNSIDATGWIGEHTYNLLRSARIPEGLPHAGEPGMDATAIRLLEQFRARYLGDTSTVRAAALAKAITYLGYTESPAGTNANMFGAWYGMNYEPWCAMATTYWFEQGSDGGSPSFQQGTRYAYCPYIVQDAQAGRNGLSITNTPAPGDLVVYSWDDDLADHVGIFEQGTPLGFTAIEGNTSVDNNSNGGEVMRRNRSVTDAHQVWFVRVVEP